MSVVTKWQITKCVIRSEPRMCQTMNTKACWIMNDMERGKTWIAARVVCSSAAATRMHNHYTTTYLQRPTVGRYKSV
jgi:hypothetical protein